MSEEQGNLRTEIHKEVQSQAAKYIVGGVVSLLAVAALGWWLYLKPIIIELAGGVPNDAIVAFERTQCPRGWDEYPKLYGRFIRGIDKSNNKEDPDGERGVGGYQTDAMRKHSHTRPRDVYDYGKIDTGATEQGRGLGYTYDAAHPAPETGEFGGDETRPKNIALLYCIKSNPKP